MITNQESPQTDFRPPRSAYYNIPKNAAATDYDKPLEINNPRSKLVFIERSLTRLANNHLIGLQYCAKNFFGLFIVLKSLNIKKVTVKDQLNFE